MGILCICMVASLLLDTLLRVMAGFLLFSTNGTTATEDYPLWFRLHQSAFGIDM